MELTNDVLSAYGLPPNASFRAVQGTKNKNWIVASGDRAIFLRRRHPSYCGKGWTEFDHAAVTYLSIHGAPVLSLIPLMSGETALCINGGVYEAYPYIDVETFRVGSAIQVEALGRALAQFHQAGSGFALSFSKAGTPRAEGCPTRMMRVLDELACDVGRNSPTLSFLREHVRLAERRVPDTVYSALPTTVCHGDVHPGNVVFQGDRCKTFVDMDWVSRQPIVYDLAFALLFFACDRETPIDPTDIWSLSQPFEFNLELMAGLLEAYQEQAGPLHADLIQVLPEQIRLTWAHCRIDGAKKVDANQRGEFLGRDLERPFERLEELRGWFLTECS